MGLGPLVCLRHMRFMRGRTTADPEGVYWLCDLEGCDATQRSNQRGNYFCLTDSQRAEVDRHVIHPLAGFCWLIGAGRLGDWLHGNDEEPVKHARMVTILFLDIDGVLNGHERTSSGYCGIKPSCADQLNRILDALPGLRIVVSSAWRYMIHGGAMTVPGFENMLLTHGVKMKGRIIGLTRPDANLSDKHERGKQIRDWVNGTHCSEIGRYAVVDDDDELGIPEAGHPFVKTDGKIGLTEADADRLIALLTSEDAGS